MVDRLARIEESIRASDGEAIRARWEFGREVLGLRQGKQLPPGLSADICQRAGISQKEMSNRVRFAEAYDELSSQLLSSGLAWTAIVNGLPPKRTAPKPPPKPRAVPTAATIKEANRVEQLIARADVAAELATRDKETAAARKAQAAVDKREREAARRQKEDDQANQQVQQALRQQLVQGDRNWENLTEQLEMMADTVKRYLDHLDGLLVPDQLRLRRLDSELGQLQARLLELRGRLWPEYQAPLPRIGRPGVVNASATETRRPRR